MESIARYQGVDKASTAYKLLSSMGWQEGEGLGAQKQGIATHVKVKRKADASGVGAAQEAATAKDWTLGMAAYDRVLAALKSVAKPAEAQALPEEPPKKKRKKSKDDAGLPASTVVEEAVPVSMKAKKSKSNSALAAPSPKPAKTESEPVETKKKAATHVGRFHKVVRNKHVKGYSSTDLAAILGASGVEQEWPRSQGTQKAEPPLAAALEVVGAPSSQGEPEGGGGSEGSDMAETLGLWWHGHFVQAGRAGSAYASFASETKRDVNVVGFSEQDQANLWHNVTDAQSKAKRGVGQGSAMKAVAGARWSGRRTVLGDSDDEAAPDVGAAAELEAAEEVDAGEAETYIVPSKRKQAKLQEAADGIARETGAGTLPTEPIMKWKKIAKAILNSADGKEMALKAFKARAWEAARAKGLPDKKTALQQMMESLSASKQFTFGKKTIQLRC